MILKTIINNLLLLGLICIVSTSSAQNYNDRCFIAQFNSDVTNNDIDALLSPLNLYIEEGPTTAFISKFALVCVDSILGWPGSIIYENEGDDDINGVIYTVTTTDDENDNIFDAIGLNYDIDLLSSSNGASSLTYHHPLEECGLNAFSINTSPGNHSTKVGILDTGIKTEGSVEINAFFDHNDLGWNIINDTPFPIDDNGHGTHMTSSISLATPSNLPSVLSLKAFKTHDFIGVASVWGLIKGIDKAMLAGVQTMSMSNSYTAPHDHRFSNAPLLVAIKEASDVAGVLFVAAAGNNGSDNDDPTKLSSYPASFLADNILAVTAVDCDYTIPYWANVGATSVDIAAPGVNIWGLDHNQQFVQMSGTSSSAAFVTRTVAMLATQHTVFDYEKIKCAIINGAKEASMTSNSVFSKGYLDAAMAQSIFDSASLCSASLPSNPTPAFSNEGIYNASIQNGGILSIDSDKEQSAQLTIFNPLGQILYSKEIDIQVGQNNFHLKELSNQIPFSMFICNIAYGSQSKTIKFVR